MRTRGKRRRGVKAVPVSVLYIIGGETFSLSKDASSLAMAPFHLHAMSETLFHEARLHVRLELGR